MRFSALNLAASFLLCVPLAVGAPNALAQSSSPRRPEPEVLSRRPVAPLFAQVPFNPTPTQFTPAVPVPAAPTSPALSAAGLSQTLSDAERTQNADALLIAYGQAVTDPTLARLAIGQLLSNYYTLRNQAQTAEQATQAVSEANLRFQVLQSAQNQVLIQQNQQLMQQNQQMMQQNQQIIALLQAQVARGR